MSDAILRSFLLFTLLLSALCSSAQDIHFTRFDRAPARLNPALAGMFSGDYRFTGHGRSQWASVPVPYENYGLALDFKWPVQPFRSGWLTGGVLLDADRAGDSNMQLIQTGLTVGYIQSLTKAVFISTAIQYRFATRSLDPGALRFDDQYNGDLFDPGLPNGETLAANSITYSSLSSGFNIRVQNPESRYRMDIGTGLYHLNQPGVSYYDDPDTRLPMLWSGYAAGVLPVAPTMDVDLAGVFRRQEAHQSLVLGIMYRYHLNLQRDSELSLATGLWYRHGDALAPALEVRYRNWLVSLSYDLNTSAFRPATLGRGGPELHVQYIWTRVQPPPVFKACPIY